MTKTSAGRSKAVRTTDTGWPAKAAKDLTRVFKSLADEHRLKILYLLTVNGEMNVSAIGQELGQSQPAVSHHLMQLRHAGLIDFRRDGKFNFYTLSHEGPAALLEKLFPEGPARVNVGTVEIAFKTTPVKTKKG